MYCRGCWDYPTLARATRSFEVTLVLYVPRLTKNLLVISTMEDKMDEVNFQHGQVLVNLRASSLFRKSNSRQRG